MKIPPRRTIVLAIGALLAAGITGGAIPANAAPPVNSGSAAAGTDCVKDIPVTSTDSITADGREVPLTAGLATLYHYNLSGTPASEVVAPDGWAPLTATDRELRTYGWPPRPVANGQAMAQWTADAQAWHPAAESGPPRLCQGSLASHVGAHAASGSTARPNTLTTTTTDFAWAGGEALKGSANIWTTDNRWTQPAFSSNNCVSESRGAQAAYVVWGGIGGDTTHNLIQAGVQTYVPDGLTNYPFFNYLNESTYTTHPNVVWYDKIATGGDDLESWVYQQTSDNTAHFSVIDHTHSWSRSIWISSGGSYYDGSTADFITESPLKGSLPVPLLRPSAGQTLLYSMTANGTGIASFNAKKITQQQGSLVIQYTNFDGVHPWYNTWNDCFN